jgi:hypothetical protein
LAFVLLALVLGACVGAGRGVLVCVIGGAGLVFGAELVCLAGVIAEVLAAVGGALVIRMAAPTADSSHHLAPKLSLPCPTAWPADWSPSK